MHHVAAAAAAAAADIKAVLHPDSPSCIGRHKN
jgi:hypothetical protein